MAEETKEVGDIKTILYKKLMEEISDSNKYMDMYQDAVAKGCPDEFYKKGIIELAYEEYTHAKFFDMMLKKYGFYIDDKSYNDLKMRIMLFC